MCQCFSENLFEKQVLSEFGAVHGGGEGCVASAALDPFAGMRMISDNDCVSTIHLCNHRIRELDHSHHLSTDVATHSMLSYFLWLVCKAVRRTNPWDILYITAHCPLSSQKMKFHVFTLKVQGRRTYFISTPLNTLPLLPS
ncbi:hypothetical protein HOLleu_37615 [Holothuria leucospilota]|uniref:Uncharacterized protein n=1 Tax=Holothuria leucospilota TaxID=206669 RepID=A0A9Q1BFF1_HOLLE|nr:hypothetical protein HOLleu_37615 [Holothuria leucospilota]